MILDYSVIKIGSGRQMHYLGVSYITFFAEEIMGRKQEVSKKNNIGQKRQQ
jgi:hypothetical protein